MGIWWGTPWVWGAARHSGVLHGDLSALVGGPLLRTTIPMAWDTPWALPVTMREAPWAIPITGTSHSTLLSRTPNLCLLLGAPHPVPIPATGISQLHSNHCCDLHPHPYLVPGPPPVPVPITGTPVCTYYRDPHPYLHPPPASPPAPVPVPVSGPPARPLRYLVGAVGGAGSASVVQDDAPGPRQHQRRRHLRSRPAQPRHQHRGPGQPPRAAA